MPILHPENGDGCCLATTRNETHVKCRRTSIRVCPDSGGVDHLKAGRDFGGPSQHGGGGAVFLVGQRHGAGHRRVRQTTTLDGEVQVQLGEHLGIGGCPLGGELDAAARDRLAAALEDQHDVVGGATACAGQQGLH